MDVFSNFIKSVSLKPINRFFFVNGHLKTGPLTIIVSVNNFINEYVWLCSPISKDFPK